MAQIDWSENFAALRAGVAADDGPAAVRRALQLGQDAGRAVVGCSITEQDRGGWRTPAASTLLALDLDRVQYEYAAGPCISAAIAGGPQRIDAMSRDIGHTAFACFAYQRGVRSSLSVPLLDAGNATALNLYSSVPRAFATERAQCIAALLARLLAALGAGAEPVAPDAVELEQARAAGSRVRAAVDRLVARDGLDRAGAFAELARRSAQLQIRIVEVADDALAEDEDR